MNPCSPHHAPFRLAKTTGQSKSDVFIQCDPIVLRPDRSAAPAGDCPLSLREYPKPRPKTKTTKAIAPRANSVSPGTRIQRRVCMSGLAMNSALRAYQ